MNAKQRKTNRLLAITPSTRGFGFVVMDEALVDWGIKAVKKDKNSQSMAKIEKLVDQYDPMVIVLPRADAKEDRRVPRIQKLVRQISAYAGTRKTKVILLSRRQVREAFFEDGKGTKYTIATILAKRFPEELGFRMPRKRRAWMNEDPNMDIFDAVALALTIRMRQPRIHRTA